MAERLAAGNGAIALLCNSLATGAMLYVLITILMPISGAHLNPAVTLAFLIRGFIGTAVALAYIGCQLVGAVLGTWLAHAMFALPILELSTTGRAEASLWLAEAVATFGLILTILGTCGGSRKLSPPPLASISFLRIGSLHQPVLPIPP
jgi:glycerol uptake facilitator-like aquaporin